MSRNLVFALILISLLVLVLLFNGGGEVSLTFGLFDLSPSRPLALFVFSAVGVLIGLLLK